VNDGRLEGEGVGLRRRSLLTMRTFWCVIGPGAIASGSKVTLTRPASSVHGDDVAHRGQRWIDAPGADPRRPEGRRGRAGNNVVSWRA
jgi:hypothetical protein